MFFIFLWPVFNNKIFVFLSNKTTKLSKMGKLGNENN